MNKLLGTAVDVLALAGILLLKLWLSETLPQKDAAHEE